jgi:sec-independent protein translocase protein TatC
VTAASTNPDEFRMSLFEHLDELRSRLLRVTLGVFGLGAFSLFFASTLYKLLMRPVLQALPADSSSLVYTSAIEELNVLMKIGLYGGIFLSTPVILWQIWGFIGPGLYENERKFAGPFIFAGTLAFFGGSLFCYLVILPSMFQFLLQKENVVAVQKRVDISKLQAADALRFARLGDFDRAGALARAGIADFEGAERSRDTEGMLGMKINPKESIAARAQLDSLGNFIDALSSRVVDTDKSRLADVVSGHVEALKAFREANFSRTIELCNTTADQLFAVVPAPPQDLSDIWKLHRFAAAGAAEAESVNWTKPMLSMTEQLTLVLVLLLAFGVIFELPLVMMVLGMLGLVKASFFMRYQRHAVVACIVLAAIITPTSDPVNLALMAVPMLLCFEIGVLLVWLVEKRRRESEDTTLANP